MQSLSQANHYRKLLAEFPEQTADFNRFINRPEAALKESRVFFATALENASVLCDETEPLKNGLQRLKEVELLAGPLVYISLTHHQENRFGGGNYAKAGLKPDGLELLRHLHGRKIAIDLSHTSDKLAEDIINALEKHSLDVPLIASHSNFRQVWEQPRNLPGDFVKEIVRREGIIGINFVRKFVHETNPGALLEHIAHGLQINDGNTLCLGSDFFYTAVLEASRHPVFFDEHAHAGKIPLVLQQLQQAGISTAQIEKFSYGNALRYLQRVFG